MDLICCFPSTFYRFLPTSWNREIWNLKREMEILMKEVIQERRDLVNIGRIESYGNDLLGLMLREGEGKQCDNRNDNNNNNSYRNNKPFFMSDDELATFIYNGHFPDGWSMYDTMARYNPELCSFPIDLQQTLYFSKMQPPPIEYPSNCDVDLWNFTR